MNKEVEAAVVYNPILEEFFCARKGKGAFLNDKKLKVNDVSNLNEALVLSGYAGVPIRYIKVVKICFHLINEKLKSLEGKFHILALTRRRERVS